MMPRQLMARCRWRDGGACALLRLLMLLRPGGLVAGLGAGLGGLAGGEASSGVDDSETGGGSGEPDHDDWPFCPSVGREEMRRARAYASALEEMLARATPSGGVDTRAMIWNYAAAVCVELSAEDAAVAARRLAWLPGSAQSEGSGAPVERRTVQDRAFDIAQLNPGWYVVRPGVGHITGLRRAYTAVIVLESVLGQLLPDGPLAVDPDTWETGQGMVRLVLRPADAVRVTVLLAYVLENDLGGSMAR